MYKEYVEIVLDKPLDEATFLDLCKGTREQRLLKRMKGMSLEELKENIRDDGMSEQIHKALEDCREGYMRIRRQWPSLGEPHEGWTYAFAAGLSLFINRPDKWVRTSVIEKIDWEGKTFTTKNSVYTFEFIEKH